MKHYYPASPMRVREDTPVGLTVPSDPAGSPLLGIMCLPLMARCDGERHSNLLSGPLGQSEEDHLSLSQQNGTVSGEVALRISEERGSDTTGLPQGRTPTHFSSHPTPFLLPWRQWCPGNQSSLVYVRGWEVKCGFATPNRIRSLFFLAITFCYGLNCVPYKYRG